MANCPDSLPIPEIGDSVALLHLKLVALEKVVHARKSIAVVTQFAATPVQQRDATKNAVKQMTPNELQWWQAYTENRFQLPNIDWPRDIGIAPTSTKPLRLARRRAEALNYLYKTDQAKPGHSVWFVEKQPEYLPLVKAMARVIGAERHLLGGQCTMNATQMTDLQTINCILSISGRILEANKGYCIPSGIGQAQQVLGSQREQLRTLLRGGEKKRKVSLQLNASTKRQPYAAMANRSGDPACRISSLDSDLAFHSAY
jgi:hypothetical protein